MTPKQIRDRANRPHPVGTVVGVTLDDDGRPIQSRPVDLSCRIGDGYGRAVAVSVSDGRGGVRRVRWPARPGS